MAYSAEHRDRTFLKCNEFLPFSKSIGKNIGKNISKNFSGKYSKKNSKYSKKNLPQTQLKLIQKEQFKKQQR